MSGLGDGLLCSCLYYLFGVALSVVRGLWFANLGMRHVVTSQAQEYGTDSDAMGIEALTKPCMFLRIEDNAYSPPVVAPRGSIISILFASSLQLACRALLLHLPL